MRCTAPIFAIMAIAIVACTGSSEDSSKAAGAGSGGANAGATASGGKLAQTGGQMPSSSDEDGGSGQVVVLMGPPLTFAPTAGGVGVNAVVASGDPNDVVLQVREAGESKWGASIAPSRVNADTAQFTPNNLQAATRYEYRLLSTAPNESKPLLYKGSFVTQRPAGEEFSFTLLTDSHISPREVQPGETLVADYAEQTLATVAQNVIGDQPDFMVNLGDMLDFHAFGFNAPPPDGLYTRQAYLNYRRLLGDALGNAAHFLVIGNWEGENGDYTLDEIERSRSMRLLYAPGPTPSTYPAGGSDYQDYYAFTWGDALFVVLNVMTYTPTSHLLSYYPGVADDWTLGEEQLTWLEQTLSSATSPWRFLLIHHAVGGKAGDDTNSAYGRGGGQAAQVGEQARVHQLMMDNNVQAFFYGHDHVFTDMVVDKIHYTLPGSAGAPWKFTMAETGYTDYWSDSGHARVHVSPSAVDVQFVSTDGSILYSYTLKK